MFSWIELALLLMKFLNLITEGIEQEKWKQSGREEEYAREAAKLLARTQKAKEIRERVAALDERAVDDLLRSMEPVIQKQPDGR